MGNFKIVWTITLSVIKLSASVNVDWVQYDQRNNLQNTYTFGYEIEDVKSNNFQFRNEKRELDGTVIGSYGYLASDGNVHFVYYVADKNGYRAKIESGGKDVDFNQRGHSKQLLDVLKVKDVYKKQTEHEQRLRPFDLLTENEKKRFRTQKSLFI